LAQGQGEDSEAEHEAGRHELLGFDEACPEDDEESHEEDVCHVVLEDDLERAEAEEQGEGCGGDEGRFAFCFKIADGTADEQEDDVDPKDGVGEWCNGQDHGGLLWRTGG